MSNSELAKAASMLHYLLFIIILLLHSTSALPPPDDFDLSEDEWRMPQATFSSNTAEAEDTILASIIGVTAGLLKRQSWAVCEAFVVGKKCIVGDYPQYEVDCTAGLTPFNFEGFQAGKVAIFLLFRLRSASPSRPHIGSSNRGQGN